MKLYIQELPAPRLYLSVPEAQPLILKSGPPAPELYLEKAKYTKRTGGPGNYKYEYAQEGSGKTRIPEQQLGFEFNENASSQQIADVLNRMKPSERDQDFLTLSEELESHGIKADTKMIGEAFDAGLVKPGQRMHVENASREDLADHFKQEVGREPVPSQETYAGPKDLELNTWNEPELVAKVKAVAEKLGMDFENNNGMLQISQNPMKIYSNDEIDRSIDPLYLDLSKGGNPNREPAMGQFIGGGAGKAHGQGQTSLEDEMKDLLDAFPGDDVEKAKYSKRTGSPGNYKYEYGEGESGGSGGGGSAGSSSSGPSGAGAGYSAGQAQGAGYASAPGGGGAAAVRSAPGAAGTVAGSSKKDDNKDEQDKKDKESKKQSGALSAIGNYFKPLTQASSYKQVPGEIAGAARAAGRYFTGKE